MGPGRFVAGAGGRRQGRSVGVDSIRCNGNEMEPKKNQRQQQGKNVVIGKSQRLFHPHVIQIKMNN